MKDVIFFYKICSFTIKKTPHRRNLEQTCRTRTLFLTYRNCAISIYLIIGESSVLVDSVHLGDFAAHRFTLQDGFLFSFGEQRYLVVNILQHDVHGRFGSQLLSSIILVGLSWPRLQNV